MSHAAAPAPAPIPPTAIKITGKFRHFDKSSGTTDDEGGESVIIVLISIS
jgi:hypothetical protein